MSTEVEKGAVFVDLLNSFRNFQAYEIFRSLRKKVYRGAVATINYKKHLLLSDAVNAARVGHDSSEKERVVCKPMYRVLARFMTTADRYDALLFHYSFILKKLRGTSALRRISSGIKIWGNATTDGTSTIRLKYSEKTRMEGELALVFCHNSVKLQTMTFTVISGESLGFGRSVVLFIGGNQGEKNRAKAIRNATKHNGEISPSAMLLMAAQSLGKILKVDLVAGVSAKHQIFLGKSLTRSTSSYDDFWSVSGGRCPDDKIFILPFDEIALPILGKNRSRTRRKRLAKREIRNEMIKSLENVFYPVKPEKSATSGKRPAAATLHPLSAA